MTIFSAQILIGWTSLILLIYFLDIDPILILQKTFGLIYDISIALLSTTTAFVLYYYNNKVNRAVKRWFKECFRHQIGNSLQHSHDIIGLEGNQLKFNTKEESINYFRQYHVAWS
ncbi:hypothetical protein KIN20_029324 [Parelaphostrongylus tenuis]|uniref:Uncharacterized protein n=1 Tax=Parelaphostrongylus tenuis TaxID=148309 RepID=A0AAD5WFE4_PARTN|nr:hypothetical protein KIN20_029324 [Parelaphostrongylus tenuis]